MKTIKNSSLFLSMLFLPAILVVLLTSSNLKKNADILSMENKLKQLEIKLEDLEHTQYKPGLGSSMLEIQTRHAKLALAGKSSNWELVDFLIHELEEGFEDVVQNKPMHDDITIAQFVPSLVMPAIEQMEKGSASKDYNTFLEGFERLTTACNSCHKATKHAYIQIRVPEESGFNNQVF